ncbi:MAG TPA: SDR family oxidoreductase [Bacteroidia bacterium]|jgi:3-oxoacyl-[acyl-carrier protein] reductase|nr:SDR family oxidoreductase [Bacteroidia bacterium]
MFAVVTGASKGIGLEIVKQLAVDEDNTVLAVARSSKELNLLKKSSPENIITFTGDITSPATLTKILALIKKNTKHVDVLINNAGFLVNKNFETISSKELFQAYNVNVFAAFLLTQKLLPLMGKKNKTHIINISSMGGVQGSSKFPGLSAYASSKAAIAGLTECLAEELKSKNIACNCLALGAVQTEMLEKAFPGYKAKITAKQMANFIIDFALTGHQYFNGKIIPVSSTTP